MTYYWLTEWLTTDSLSDWLLTHWAIDHWLTEWLTTDSLSAWLLTYQWLTEWLTIDSLYEQIALHCTHMTLPATHMVMSCKSTNMDIPFACMCSCVNMTVPHACSPIDIQGVSTEKALPHVETCMAYAHIITTCIHLLAHKHTWHYHMHAHKWTSLAHACTMCIAHGVTLRIHAYGFSMFMFAHGLLILCPSNPY